MDLDLDLERREARLSAATTALTMLLAMVVMAVLASERRVAPLAFLGVAGAALAAATGLVVSVSFAVPLPGHPSWDSTMERKRAQLRRGEVAAAVGTAALGCAVVAQLAVI